LQSSQANNRAASIVDLESENQSIDDNLENYVTDIARGKHSETDPYFTDDDNIAG